MLTAAVKRDGVKPGMQTAVEGAREAEKLKRERETICFQDWLINSGLLGEVSENARPKEREGERERGVDEFFCNLCATDDFLSALFTLTHFSLESHWDVTVNQ